MKCQSLISGNKKENTMYQIFLSASVFTFRYGICTVYVNLLFNTLANSEDDKFYRLLHTKIVS